MMNWDFSHLNPTKAVGFRWMYGSTPMSDLNVIYTSWIVYFVSILAIRWYMAERTRIDRSHKVLVFYNGSMITCKVNTILTLVPAYADYPHDVVLVTRPKYFWKNAATSFQVIQFVAAIALTAYQMSLCPQSNCVLLSASINVTMIYMVVKYYDTKESSVATTREHYKRRNNVFIAGSGVSGLYAAIVLSKIGLSVHIADTDENINNNNELLLFSPRSLQLLAQLDLLGPITQRGIRHWKFEIYQTKGQGSNAVIMEPQSIRLWDNESTEFTYSISCQRSIVIEIFKDYLEKEGIQIDEKQEIIHIEERNQKLLSDAELSLYYQYRPLPMIHQPDEKILKSIHLKHRETKEVNVWKSQAIIGADGQMSFIRQKLGLSLVNYKQQQYTRAFYTLHIDIASTNFPGVRQISTICKNKDILYIIGHQTHLYITFEHKPSWTKLSIDEEIPLHIATRHVKCVMDPYNIEFRKVRSYYRWNGNNISSCEEYNVDTSCFLIGSAAQSMNPPGLFDINTNIEQVQNLCWKLALSLQHSASPKLLETFEPEVRIKTEESMHASAVFTNLIGDYYKELTNNLNASHSRDLAYQLQRFKSCFVGNTPFTANILNNGSNSDGILLPDDTGSTPSFEFMGPPRLSNNFAPSVMAGFLAPNAKLKPYTLFQLLFTSSSSSQQTIKPTTTLTNLPSTIKSIEEIKNVSLTVTTKDLKNSRRRRSNSVTTNNLSSIWSSIPLFQKNSSSSNSSSGNKKRSNNNSPTTTSSSTATSATALISPDRWKSIKPNHLQLLDRIQSFNKNSCTFTILIFCGSITETQERTRNFVKLLESPASFIHRYERAHSNRDTNNRNSTVSLNSPTAESFYQGGRQSLDQPRRDSFESFVDQSRFSTSTMSSSSTYNHHAVSNALFSVLFISSSTRSEAVKYLNNTPPATVHSTFPSGLTQVFLDHDGQCYKAYNIGKQNEVIVIRPDGYIGTRAPILKEEEGFEHVSLYFDSFLRPPVDMNTAAAVVAAGYDC
ncbi:hypothetical protein BDF21DRAFT_490948 [Thamnidium elegans]|nr:hypothetical protein BDF21DRAFT_490948 [Thamnidium elegans]